MGRVDGPNRAPDLNADGRSCTLVYMKVSAAQFKAKMGRYMKAVRQGEEVILTDRDEPVARLTPFRRERAARAAWPVDVPADPGAPPLGELTVAAIRYRGRSTLELLRDDRQRR